MPDEIDPQAVEWPYRQIADLLAAEIRAGRWTPGRPIDSEKIMCARFGVARMTLRRAYESLRADGLIFTVPHRGTFVSDPLPDKAEPRPGEPGRGL
ncbi:winged helix-turn-helix domain-containing protein [Kitasatospora sp. NPDC058170]|uniref:winged helix-turn-helix domain-containing protein n=1 Tax=Kitasatospora sp. NPDC058170 TaxID=3346364 RepID=UPI0036D880FD